MNVMARVEFEETFTREEWFRGQIVERDYLHHFEVTFVADAQLVDGDIVFPEDRPQSFNPPDFNWDSLSKEQKAQAWEALSDEAEAVVRKFRGSLQLPYVVNADVPRAA